MHRIFSDYIFCVNIDLRDNTKARIETRNISLCFRTQPEWAIKYRYKYNNQISLRLLPAEYLSLQITRVGVRGKRIPIHKVLIRKFSEHIDFSYLNLSCLKYPMSSYLEEFYDSTSFLWAQPSAYSSMLPSSWVITGRLPFIKRPTVVLHSEGEHLGTNAVANQHRFASVRREPKDILNPSRGAQSVGVYPRRDRTIP